MSEIAFEIGRLYPWIKNISDVLTTAQHGVIDTLPGLLGYWLGGTRNISGFLLDHGTGGIPLGEVGSCPTGYDGNAFVHLGNGTNYLGTTSDLGVQGDEPWITPSLNGLTVGGWFMTDSTPATLAGMVSQWAITPDRGYGLVWLAADKARFLVSSNGAAAFLVDSAETPTGAWNFIAGRFIPGTELAVIVNGNKAVNTTAIPATVNVSAADFNIGRTEEDDDFIFHGKARDVFICAAALSDALIEKVRQATSP